MATIYAEIGGRIDLQRHDHHRHHGRFQHPDRPLRIEREEELNLMITGGPDGDLGANQIQCYKGKICLIIDGGSVLFDPQGLDREELMKIAFMRHTPSRGPIPRFFRGKTRPQGFRVPIDAANVTLAGRHRWSRTAPSFTAISCPIRKTGKYIAEADIRAFIPCGGFKDTINQGQCPTVPRPVSRSCGSSSRAPTSFSTMARGGTIATPHRHQADQGYHGQQGRRVFSSSIAEVLTAFLLQEDYEAALHERYPATRWALIQRYPDAGGPVCPGRNPNADPYS